MNPFKKLAGQTAVYGLPTIIGRLLNYLLVPLYTRVFAPAEYGVVTEIYAYVAFLFVFMTYGMETAFFRFSTNHDQKERVFATSLFSLLITSLIVVVAAFAFSGSLSNSIGYAENSEYIRWFTLILAADAISSIPYAYLRLKNKALRFSLIKVVNIATNIAFNLLFIVFLPWLLKTNPDLTGTWFFSILYNPQIGVGYIFISNLIASLITLAMLLPTMFETDLKPDLKLLKEMLKYSWPLMVFGLAGIINETFDRVILKHLLPGTDAMAQLGIYGACYKVSILMTLFIQTYRYAAEPFFFDHSRSQDAKKTYARLMHYFIIICLFIYLLIMLNIDIVILFIGPEFREGADVIPILLWANLFLGVFYNLSVWFKLTDKTLTGAMISVTGAVITLVLNFILIPYLGYMGAAWATFICYASMMLISWYLGKRYYPINYNLKSAGYYTLLTLVLYFISFYTPELGKEIRYTINILLLLCFITIVYIAERKQLRMKDQK